MERIGFSFKEIGKNVVKDGDDAVLAKIFSRVEKDELIKFFIEQLYKNEQLSLDFINHFTKGKKGGGSIEYYRERILGFVDQYADDGFIDYHASFGLAEKLENLVDQAGEYLENNSNVLQGIYICLALISEIPNILSEADDSNGEISGCADTAFGILSTWNDNCHGKYIKERLLCFDYFLQEYKEEKYSNFGYEGNVLDLLVGFADTKEQGKKVLSIIDQELTTQKSEWRVKSFLDNKILLIKMFDSSIDAYNIYSDYLHFSDVRKKIIEMDMDKKDFATAKKHALEGITQAEKQGHPGTVNNFLRLLYEIAEKEQNRDDMRNYAKQLFLDSNDRFEWYKTLKTLYDPIDWKLESNACIGEIEKTARYGYPIDLIGNIYVYENRIEDLMNMLKKHDAHLYIVERFEHVFDVKFAQDLIELYKRGIEQEAKDTGRKIYEKVIHYCKKLQKISGGREILKELLDDFRVRYANRRAMLEMINKAFPGM